MLEIGSLAIRNGMEYSPSGCVCFSSRGNEGMGYAKERKGIRGLNRISKFLLLLAGFVVWMAHYSTLHSEASGWTDRQNRQTERQTWPVISVD